MSETMYVVAPNWGAYEGWGEPCGVYLTEERALAAIGRALVERLYFADRLRVIAITRDAPITDPADKSKPENAKMGEGA